MPLTRSQKGKDVPLSVNSSASLHTEQMSKRTQKSEGTTSEVATASTSSIAESSGTTATLTESNMEARSLEPVTRLDKLKMAERKNQSSSLRGSTRASVKSVRTTSSTARQRAKEARLKLARLELECKEAAANLARIEYEDLEENDDSSSVGDLEKEQEDRASHVQKWIETSPLQDGEAKNTITKQENKEQGIVKTEQSFMSTVQVQTLAGAIRQAFDNHTSTAMKLSSSNEKFMQDLPYFDGTSSEWVAFRVVYEDTSKFYTATQNMARLRKAIKGAARNTFKSLLYSDATPDQVMNALQRRYGRPDSLVMEELDRIKALPKITANPKDICSFASDVHNCIQAIQGLKKPQYLHSPVIVREILEKLPTYLKFRWYEYADTHEDEDPDLVMMAKFLNKQADTCGAYAPTEKKKHVRGRESVHTTVADEDRDELPLPKKDKKDKKWVCIKCQGNHYLTECQGFLKMSIEERWTLAIEHRICFKCLMGKHRKERCRRPPCKSCKRAHHSLLHSDSRYAENNAEAAPSKHELVKEVTELATSITLPVHAITTTKAYLKIIPVEVFGPNGSQKVLALLDEGSTVSLLDSRVAKNIGAKGTEEELVLETVGGKLIRKRDSKRLNLTIRGVHQKEKKNLNRVRTIDELNLAPQFVDKESIEACSHLKEITSILYYDFESPQLLIGQDNWELIVSQEIKRGKPGQPVASLTELGWVLHGFDNRKGKPVHFLNKCMHLSTVEDEMHKTIKDHFAIESLGVQPRRPTIDSEARALAILDKTCRRREDDRFEVGLLWKNEEEKMPDSYPSAKQRLLSIEKKIDKDPDLKKEYIRQIQHLLDENYAEEAPNDPNSERKWYLPHFSVVHPLKKKVRIVFDAAAKVQGKSLNDALLPGPDLLQSLFGVLIRFRQGPIAVAADIKEMFLQIKIRPEDRDSLRFLWREGRQDIPPKEYRMSSVIFGATSSPSTAIFIKNKNADEFKEQYPDAARAIEHNHYMDDYLHSFHSEEALVKVAREVDLIHRKASFELRGWASNRPQLLQKITKENAEKTEIELGENEEKTLGLRWLTKDDSLGFRTSLQKTPKDVLLSRRIPTKREVTSAVMSTFDPLGLASPVLIQGKKLLQNIWRSGIGWDDQIADKDQETWRSYVNNLELLKNLHVPRCIAPYSTEGELHIFTDASETAYAAVAYWRTETIDGSYHVTLIAGKARVSPLKPVSVPRLELQAALLGSRLAHSLTQELDLNIKKKTYWTDSSVVLSWIKSDPRTFKTFVAHRLAEIEDTTQPHEWRWVSTSNNPADDGTREVPENFSKNHRWFTGPEFLKQDEKFWPEKRTFKKEKTGEERDKDITANVADKSSHMSPDPERFSSWIRLWRTMARVLQFISLCRRNEKVNISRRLEQQDPTWKRTRNQETRKIVNSNQQKVKPCKKFIPIGPGLLEQAEVLLLKRSQAESFKEEIYCMKHSKTLPNSSRLKKLDVEIDNGLLRLRGRINAIQGMSNDYKNPIVLDSKNRITRLIIEHYHKRFNHGNHATVMNELRQRFLILGLRSAVRSTVHNCQWCKTHRSKPKELPMGDLPPERLRYGAPPFTCTAVDYFGPLTVKVGRRHEKRWGALFTCLTIRAVHIELVPSLSTSSMIMALRRFAARRGMPKILFSDNATNFVAANKELKQAIDGMEKESLIAEAEMIGIQWKFIPPGAPNMGGAWERLVRSIKTALSVTLKERTPQEETLHTLLLEAEHIVNSRPLTNAADNTEEEALTPNHFLIGRSNGAARIGVFTDQDLVGRETWKTTQQLTEHFWKRWLKEYLPTLLPRRTDGKSDTVNLKEGDIVLIVDSSLPRCTWPRGKVQTVYPGPDGRTRIVDVETKGGILRRPSSRIVLLVPSP